MANIKLINADCMDIMKEYPDNYFDLAIVDPPFGINASKGTSIITKNSTWIKARYTKEYDKKEWDNKIPNKKYFDELFRISENQIIWGGNYFIKYLPPNNNWIIWDKKLSIGNYIFSPFEMAWSSNGKCKIFRYLMEGYKIENNKDRCERIHPTQKPIALYKWLLQKYAKSEYKIIDTHLGSGSSAIAAYIFGYKEFIGIEIDKEYFEAAKSRYEKYIKKFEREKQLQLFDPVELDKKLNKLL